MTFFVSYSHQDSEIVDRICNELACHLVKVWKDRWRLSPGEELTDSIVRRIEEASYFCIVLSRESVESEWVRKELAVALRRPRADNANFIIPLLIEDCEVPEPLRDLSCIDLRTDFDAGMRRLIGYVSRKYNVNLEGRLEDGRDYSFDFLISEGEQEGRLFLDIDMVAHDVEARYSIMAQFHVVGTEHATRAALDLSQTDRLARILMPLLVERYSGKSAIRILSGDIIDEDQFPLMLAPDRVGFLVKLRVVRLGQVPRNVVLFPVRRYLEQMIVDAGLDEGEERLP